MKEVRFLSLIFVITLTLFWTTLASARDLNQESGPSERAQCPVGHQNLPPSERAKFQVNRESTPTERDESPLLSNPDRIVHLVRPHDTDPAINIFLKDHYAYFQKTAPKNGKLLVFLPGTFATPRGYQWFVSEAARLGYLAIGLEYPNIGDPPNKSSVYSVCAGSPSSDCNGLVRESRMEGTHAWPSVMVDRPNSAMNRLEKVLAFLAQQYPDEGWGTFFQTGAIVWDRIVLAGHSQGAGMAAWLSKKHNVARVILFSGGPDMSHGKLAAWVTKEGVTLHDRFYAVVHASESGFGERSKLGYTALGVPIPLYRFDETNVTTPIPDGTRGFVVALPPRNDECEHKGTATPAHNSVVVDKKTPIGSNGWPAYLPVWDAMLR